MSQLQKLKAARSTADLALLLGYKASALSYLIYKKPLTERYRSFHIPKKSGGVRLIDAPSPDLKQLQRRLADLLQNCQSEIQSTSKSSDSVAHGFVRDRSIITNARGHRRRKYVFNLDLKDFFGTINFGRVRGFLITDKAFQLDAKIATVVAQIACYENRLPQGSPCSPVISNLIGHILDVHLVRLAKRHRVHYTRYADDLTFSTSQPEFPSEIALRLSTGEWQIGSELWHLLSLSGFSANLSKTRMRLRTSRQEVTGLVVNQKVNIPSDYRRTVRAMVHRLFRTGEFELDGSPGTADQLRGMLGHIDRIDIHNKNLRAAQADTKELSRKESMYRDFLFYKEFFATPKPVIICEGKTDNVYLKLAINALASKFPQLATVDATGKVTRTVRIYRYADTSTGRVLQIHGGTPDLAKLIKTYTEEAKRFTRPTKQYPFIFLVDNDSGSKAKGGIYSAVLNATKGAVKVDPTKAYTHVSVNLFVVPTPLLSGGLDSQMEDFFDDTTKSTIVGGKSFDASNEYDTATHYGKHIFAQKVVLAKASTINFDGFSSILKSIAEIVDSF